MDEEKDVLAPDATRKADDADSSPGAPFAVGLALGVAFGIVFDNLALGIALGMCGGILFAGVRNNKAQEKSGSPAGSESSPPRSE